MKQQFVKHTYNAMFGANQQWMPLVGGVGAWSVYPFSSDQVRHPWSLDGTFRNLTVTLRVALANNCTLTVLKDGVATALTVTIPAGQTAGSETATDLACVAGTDDWCLQLDGTVGGGFDLSYAIEFESGDDVSSGYAAAGFGGSLTDGQGKQGGAFGNGNLAAATTLPPTGPDDTATYSLSGLDGNIVRLDALALSGAPGVGVSWKCYLIKNQIIQDGTGGTVNTLCEITGAVADRQSRTFTLPVTLFDHVEYLIMRIGANAPFALGQVACSCAVEADIENRYMICGGNNNVISNTVVGYQWNQSEQSPTNTSEVQAQAPIGPSGVLALALYTERTDAPGDSAPGASYTDTLRKNGADTALSVAMIDTSTTASVTGSVAFAEDDLINLSITPALTPHLGQLHWVLAAQSGVTPTPPAPSGTTYQTRRVRRFQLPYNENLRMFLRRLEFIVQSGVGLTTGQGSDPVIMLRISRDGGHTFGTERQLSVGALGQYKTRVFGNNFGYYRDGVAEISMTDPVFWALLSCTAKIDEGTS